MDDQLAREIATKTAKYLRHDPEALGVTLDRKGWVSLADLHHGFMETSPHDFEVGELRAALEGYNYKRFQFDSEGRVRALSGHTTSQVRYDIAEPTSEFFYVTYPSRHYDKLHDLGIVPRKKRYTRVFPNPLMAHKDARRRRIKGGVLVVIDAMRAYHDGTLFYQHEGEWYVTDVEPSHLDLQDIVAGEDS